MTDLESARLAGASDAYGKVASMVQRLLVEHRSQQPDAGYLQAMDDVSTGLLELLGVRPLDELKDQLAGTVTETDAIEERRRDGTGAAP